MLREVNFRKHPVHSKHPVPGGIFSQYWLSKKRWLSSWSRYLTRNFAWNSNTDTCMNVTVDEQFLFVVLPDVRSQRKQEVWFLSEVFECIWFMKYPKQGVRTYPTSGYIPEFYPSFKKIELIYTNFWSNTRNSPQIFSDQIYWILRV